MTAILFVTMLAVAQAPTEPPAASRRPNPQVLKTVPESQLFLMMNAIADSLGVRCDHYHVLPFFVRFSNGAPYSTSTRVFTSIKHNVAVDDAIFERPVRFP